MTPSWNINNMTVTYVVSVLWGPFFFCFKRIGCKKGNQNAHQRLMVI